MVICTPGPGCSICTPGQCDQLVQNGTYKLDVQILSPNFSSVSSKICTFMKAATD